LANGISKLTLWRGGGVLVSRQMNKSDLARDLAIREGIRVGDAADEMDLAINRIIRTLRRGQSAHLPGLGTIKPGKEWTFRRERNVH
jgi:nucleoid DNA-binding protein